MVNSQEKFITKSNEIHGGKYDYSLVEYKNTGTKVNITCPTHGVFSQSPEKHLIGQGCPKCRGSRISTSKRMTVQEFEAKSRKVHGDLYDYSLVDYINAHTKVTIVCKKHGKFEQTPNNHLWDNNGCPPCKNNCVSRPATKWLNSLSIDTIREFKIPETNYKVDGYDPHTNIVYEYLGRFWHGCLDTYNPDDINPVNKVSFRELNRCTMERFDIIRNLGYTIHYKWGD